VNDIFRIHHLSDTHIGPLHYEDYRRSIVTYSRNLELYCKHLRELGRADLPDVVIISGDLTCMASGSEMLTAQKQIDTIVKNLARKNSSWRANEKRRHPYVMIVPGNHDVDWTEKTDKGKIKRYAQLADNVYQNGDVLSAIYVEEDEERPVYHDFGEHCNVFIYLLSTIRIGETRNQHLISIYEKAADQITRAGNQSMYNRTELEELQGYLKRDPGYMDQTHLDKMLDTLKKGKLPDSRCRIAVMHHNPTSVPQASIDDFDIIINSGSLNSALTEGKFDIVLHGHSHLSHCTRLIPLSQVARYVV
jgi:Icc-related predicted phosphoesterase